LSQLINTDDRINETFHRIFALRADKVITKELDNILPQVLHTAVKDYYFEAGQKYMLFAPTLPSPSAPKISPPEVKERKGFLAKLRLKH
jgi:hypothetical protein